MHFELELSLSLYFSRSQIFYVLLTHPTNAFQTYEHLKDTLIRVRILQLRIYKFLMAPTFNLTSNKTIPHQTTSSVI